MEEIRQAYEIVQQNWKEIAFGGMAVREVSKWGMRYIAEHYRNDSAAVVGKAAENAADFTQRLSAKVSASVEAGVLSEAQVEAALTEPGFVKLMQAAVIDASETSSDFNHEQLAKLVGARMLGPAESAPSIILRLAASHVKNLTREHLHLLGLTLSVTRWHPDAGSFSDMASYAALCQTQLAPFDGVVLDNVGFYHLESIGLLTLKPPDTVSHLIALHANSIMMVEFQRFQSELTTGNVPAIYRRLTTLLYGEPARGIFGMNAVRLNSIGAMIGYSVSTTLHDEPFDPAALPN